MSVDTFNACIEGYTDHMFDMHLNAVQQGYWSAYFTNSKHPKSMAKIQEMLVDTRYKQKTHSKHADDVDVDEFLRREAEFNAKLSEMEK